MNGTEPILTVAFFRTASGNEPVREWLKSQPREEHRILGEDIKPVQFGCRLECRSFASSTGFVGSPFPPAPSHRTSHLHQRRRPNGLAPRVHQGIADDAAGGCGTCENAAATAMKREHIGSDFDGFLQEDAFWRGARLARSNGRRVAD